MEPDQRAEEPVDMRVFPKAEDVLKRFLRRSSKTTRNGADQKSSPAVTRWYVEQYEALNRLKRTT